MDDTNTPEATEHATLRQEMAHLRSDFSNMKHDLERVTADEARASVKKVGDEVELHPFISMSTAFGVGLIIGKVLSRH